MNSLDENKAGTSEDDIVADQSFKPALGETEHTVASIGFHLVERILLLLVALMTIAGAAAEIYQIYETRSINLADILLMFLYTEVIGMVSVFYTGKGATFIYPIFIAITALARLIVLQSKDMAPENIVFEASAILLLAMAAMAMTRFTVVRAS
ncbi:phosphate-starvation-inducible PsiE family protein [Sphingomonas sp. 10B4]|uniref:phosphate-starvation-inducible PsiE family protein n=1 Tax=Sphingomonas sp. 10B4 TaxID=3048575 RepID=UPI002AB55238|nr:phosphate-starvation-inducible PsiE family protein [Sphingomonas sp. 10B4]MDY7523162.1 phosphate-starvation-inducible PsiE family protein [Sphingomonas sp. 10B4]MEB0284554.1 phosphate-starvation-inducible PsiE family protein [Sphingomonas sp. 10B4]